MFTDDTLYDPRHADLTALVSSSTLAQWRHESRGPAYIKIGARVFYRGADLNAWLASRTVRPTDAPPPQVAA